MSPSSYHEAVGAHGNIRSLRRRILKPAAVGLSLASAIAFLCSTPSFATETERVAVVHQGEDELAVRLSAELFAQGFSPKVVAEANMPSEDTARQIARRLRCAAAMRIVRTVNRLHVWVDIPSDRVSVTEEVSVSVSQEDAKTLLVFKSVELLRSSLGPISAPGPLQQRPAAPMGERRGNEVTLPKDTLLLNGSRQPRVALDVEAALTLGFGESPPSFEIGVALRGRLYRRLGLFLFGLVPTLPMRIEAPLGSVEFRAATVDLGLDLSLLPEGRPVSVTIGLGAGPLFLSMKGRANEPYVSKSAFLVTAMPVLLSAAAFSLTDFIALRADVLVGMPLKRPVIQMLDLEVSDFSRPLLSILFGLEVRLL